jgi:hypothetical protein
MWWMGLARRSAAAAAAGLHRAATTAALAIGRGMLFADAEVRVAAELHVGSGERGPLMGGHLHAAAQPGARDQDEPTEASLRAPHQDRR